MFEYETGGCETASLLCAAQQNVFRGIIKTLI